MATVLLLLLLVVPLMTSGLKGEALSSLNCPQAPCWRYWNRNCYCVEPNRKATWYEALKFCKRYKQTELVTFANFVEKSWIMGLHLDNFWIGLNNLDNMNTFSWSEGTPANMKLSWLQLLHPVQLNTTYCVKVSRHSLIALQCRTKAHWICKRSAFVDRYQKYAGKVLLSPSGSSFEVHKDLISAKMACLELRDQCTGVTIWKNGYALARGTVLLRSEESSSVTYVKSDCSMGYFGTDCSSVCKQCYGDELCNPYTGACDEFHSCRAQHSPSVCEQALKSVWCPRFSGWKYWNDNCYYFSAEHASSWEKAQKECRRFRSTDLLWLESKRELNWIFAANASEILWIGLNSKKQKYIWVWSNSKSAAKELHWLHLKDDMSGRCAGLASANHSVMTLNCNKNYKWICKRRELVEVFDIYVDQFLSGPMDTTYYTSFSSAIVDCLSDFICTGIVQDYQYYRRTRGIDQIDTFEESATSYIKRECSFGYYGKNCASVCVQCPGGLRCNSVTGKCPDKMQCIGTFKGELCELGIKNPKCPPSSSWWFFNGHCYYFENEVKEQFPWASARCSYFKDGQLVKIDFEKEKEWLAAMLKVDSWIGLLYERTTWKWSGGRHDVNATDYKWLWNFPSTADGCALMTTGGSLQALPCTEPQFFICEKEIAGLDLFIDYPGKIMLAVHPLAEYRDLDDARFYCMLNVKCTGISTWPNAHYLVSGEEMVDGLAHHIFRLKTSCLPGRYGDKCDEECPACRENTRCNMLTGFCDDKTTCKDLSSIHRCAETTVSQRCPDMNMWHYWNRHCYYFSREHVAKTWAEANATCTRFRAAELLWYEDITELDWISNFVLENMWIGLQDMNYDEVWAWSHEDDASGALDSHVKHMDYIPMPSGKKRCVYLLPEGKEYAAVARCSEKKQWGCKRPAESDLDVYMGFWDSVVISPTPSLSTNSTYNKSRDECVKQMHMCLGYGLWQSEFYILNGPILVGGGFGPSVTFLKSACDYGYYGFKCEFQCPVCHWGKPCHPVNGMCESTIVCATPNHVGACSLGLYSLKCSLGSGWWYWQGKCYLIEKNRKVTWKEARELCLQFKHTRILLLEDLEEKLWLQKKITEQMWIGMKWDGVKKEWQWANDSSANTNQEWLSIKGDTFESCGTLLPDKSQLQSEKCQKKYYFICQRNENMNIFQDFKGYIIPQRQKTLPKIYYTLEAAQEECMFEKTICTGVVSSQGQYYTVSGSTVFQSMNAGDILHLKTACNPGFYGTNCQFHCKWCENGLPCHGVTGECVGNASVKCVLDSQDPTCDTEAVENPCPKKPNWYYYLKSCYYVEETKTDTWVSARSFCQGYKGTDLVKITSSLEKMWVQYSGYNSWIGLTFQKLSHQYLWVDYSSSVFQNAWVIRRNRRYTNSSFDCGVAFKNYLSVTDCSQERKWICKRNEAVDLFTEHAGRAIYFPDGNAPTYSSLESAKKACLVSNLCTGVVETKSIIMLHTGVQLYNTRNRTVKTWIKSDCAPGRFGEMCEQICHKCDDGVPCSPHTGLCGDGVFCNSDDPTFTCEKGILISGRCSDEGWMYWHGNCYYVYNRKRNWLYGRDTCRQFRDSDLLWISNTEEESWLLSKLPKGDFWTGLYGDRFCTRLQWSYSKVYFDVPEWLHAKWWRSWTFTWRCCVQFSVSRGDMPRTSCNQHKAWVCKRREEESLDFRRFEGYYLVGANTDPGRIVHSSFHEAFQHCRFKRHLCSGVQRIKSNFTTLLAQRLVLINGSSSNQYTAYLKTACSPGYYGPLCELVCSCNGTDNCNPINGECAENEQCNEDYIASDCQEGVVNLKCPSDPGWWYWKGNCYYIETVTLLTWDKARDFCSNYHGTKLLSTPSSLEEQTWLISIVKDFIWISTAKDQSRRATCGTSCGKIAVCTQMDTNGTLSQTSCSSLAAWVCKRNVDVRMFWEYPEKMLILPLGKRAYAIKEQARSACRLEEKCTGISYWNHEYIPVSGKELILAGSKHDTTFMKTACVEGHFGTNCQKYLDCPKEHPCNRLTGKCAGDVTCQEKSIITRCETKLKSKYCYHSWTYYDEHCYYIPEVGLINKSDAEYMCSHFEKASLLHLSSQEEKDWLGKVTQKRIWLRGVSSVFQPKVWLQSVKYREQRTISEFGDELCLQLDPVLGFLLSAPCSHNASWMCKAPIAPKQVDAQDKWWMSMLISAFVSSIVTIVTVLVTYKLGFWIPEKVNEVKPQPL